MQVRLVSGRGRSYFCLQKFKGTALVKSCNPEGALMVDIPVIDTGRMDTGTKDTGSMTVDEFYAFTDTRPDEEKWELIEGEPVLNASPSPLHQLIVMNVAFTLMARQREIKAPWRVLPDLGVRVSEKNRPQPDVLVLPSEHPLDGRRDLTNVVVLFEVLSPSTEDRDLGWKRKAYASLASLTHYIVISQGAVEVRVFARDDKFEGRKIQAIELRTLGVSLPMAEIYRDTGLTA
jgi:Uma2 family endonuclease